jgi:hypothetical protein
MRQTVTQRLNGLNVSTVNVYERLLGLMNVHNNYYDRESWQSENMAAIKTYVGLRHGYSTG